MIIDTTKDFEIKDSIYCNRYRCPNCSYPYIKFDDDCGSKIEWIGEDQPDRYNQA